MQTKTRLAIFLAFLWLVVWSILYFIVDGNVSAAKIEGFLLLGVLPPVTFLLGWWVKLGFDADRGK